MRLLTRQEVRILELHAPQKIAAAKLGITERTVRLHQRSIVQKFEADSWIEAVYLFGLARGHTDPDPSALGR